MITVVTKIRCKYQCNTRTMIDDKTDNTIIDIILNRSVNSVYNTLQSVQME